MSGRTGPQRAADGEYVLRNIAITLCDGCLHGLGPSCNTPGCAFIRMNIQDCPITEYEEIAPQPGKAPESGPCGTTTEIDTMDPEEA